MSAVPYKPYQSKRHSRNLSNNFTPPQSPPLVAVGSPSRTSNPQSSNDASKRLSIPPISFNYIDNALVDVSPSPPASVPPPQAAIVTPPVISNGHTPEPEPEPEPEPVLPAPVPTPIAVPVAIVEVPPSPISEPATPRIVEEQRQSEPEPKTADVKANDEADETPATSATPPPVPSKGDLAPAVPRPRPLSMSHSTFRHVPARASPLRPSSSIIKSGMSAPSSPLGSGPFTNHSSLALGPQSRPSTAAGSTSHFRPRTTSALSAASPRVLDFSPGQSPLPSPSANGAQPLFPSSPSLQAQARPSMASSLSSTSSIGAFSPSKSPHSTPAEIASPSKGTSAPPSAPSSPSRPPISPSPSPNPGSSALPSGSSTSTVQAPRPRVMSSNAASRTSSNVGSAPYRHGFQPKGVYGLRTDEFLELRRTKRDLSRIEDRRLERRLEKLINLHFSSGSHSDTPDPSKPPANRRQSSFFDFDLSDLKGKNASDLWRGMLDSAATSRLGGGNHAKGEIRLQEQAITPWQEDALVPACPICLTSFNTLTNRKHHCRLCGKVVCALPVKPPQRAELCSFLFVVESGTGKIEELGGDMVDYGVKRKDLTPSASGDAAKKLMEEQEKYLKGVRICKDCRPTLRRRQYSVEAKTVPPFARLYAALLELEREIEEMLPTFQEVVIRLSQEDESAPSTPTTISNSGSQNPTKQAASLRKQLLEAFQQYDAIAKRIKGLKTPGASSSQEKVQTAIANRATLFLQRNMFPLQSLPKPKKATHSKNNSTNTLSNLMEISDQDSALAHTLQPLLEQEALLESFIEEANAQRKFEDAKTLKVNLKEIRVEIDKLLNGSQGVAGTGLKAGNAR